MSSVLCRRGPTFCQWRILADSEWGAPGNNCDQSIRRGSPARRGQAGPSSRKGRFPSGDNPGSAITDLFVISAASVGASRDDDSSVMLTDCSQNAYWEPRAKPAPPKGAEPAQTRVQSVRRPGCKACTGDPPDHEHATHSRVCFVGRRDTNPSAHLSRSCLQSGSDFDLRSEWRKHILLS